MSRGIHEKVWNMSQLFVTLVTLYIYPTADKQLRRHLAYPFREFPCIYNICITYFMYRSLALHKNNILMKIYAQKSIDLRIKSKKKTLIYLDRLYSLTKFSDRVDSNPVGNYEAGCTFKTKLLYIFINIGGRGRGSKVDV